MTGSLRARDGVWYTIINYKENNKYKRKEETTNLPERGNKKAAQVILNERMKAFKEKEQQEKDRRKRRVNSTNEPLGTADSTFVDYCMAYILSIKNNLSPTVFNIYYKTYIKSLSGYFNDKKLIDITSEDIDDFNDYLRANGLSENSIKKHANIIRPALRKAYLEDNLIIDNPYETVRKIKTTKPTVNYYNKQELEKLFDHLKGHKIELMINMLAHYGLRRSELLGLRWKAIDFDHDIITINHKVLVVERTYYTDDQLKTSASHRTLPLIDYIKKDLLKWKNQIEQNRTLLGNTYDTKWEEYVFVNEKGTLIQPDYLTGTFNKFLKKNQLKKIRLHDLRHSCASLLLANGINLKQIQEWLGHANFSTTANVYSHLDFSSKVQSANTIAQSFNIHRKRHEETKIEDEVKLAELIKALGYTERELIDLLEKKQEQLESKVEEKKNYSM